MMGKANKTTDIKSMQKAMMEFQYQMEKGTMNQDEIDIDD